MILSKVKFHLIGALAVCAGVSLPAVGAWADEFFSGRVDINGSVAGGNAVLLAKEANAAAGGFSYDNQWTAGSGGMSAPGNKLTSVGFVPVSAARVGNAIEDLATGLDLVAVYAIEGVTQLAGVGQGGFNERGNFNPNVSVPGGTLTGGFGG